MLKIANFETPSLVFGQKKKNLGQKNLTTHNFETPHFFWKKKELAQKGEYII